MSDDKRAAVWVQRTKDGIDVELKVTFPTSVTAEAVMQAVTACGRRAGRAAALRAADTLD